MATITKALQEEINSLRDAANDGLSIELKRYILRTLALIDAAPGVFNTSAGLEEYLETLTDLISVKVNRG